MISRAVVVCFTLYVTQCLARDYNARAWQKTGEYPTGSDFPEQVDENVKKRTNVAIGFTGGGSRSYIASVGYMAALTELDLVKNTRYLGGISGGSWFTLNYVYSQLNVDDATLLGPIVDPADITQKGLQQMNPSCMRAVTSTDYVPIMLKAIKAGLSAGEAWVEAYQEVYLAPLDIPLGAPPAWSQQTINEIVAKNPDLANQKFVLPRSSERPFPIVSSTLIGPEEGAPYDYGDNRNLSLFEMTPLYVGTQNSRKVEYHYKHGLKHTVSVGGLVEPFAFSMSDEKDTPLTGLQSDEASAYLKVPPVEHNIDLAHMGGSSSYAIGMFMDTLPSGITDDWSLKMKYWSPTDRLPSAKDTLFADGGCYENVPVSSFLQRRVEKMVLFFNSHTPLQPASSWDVYNDVYTGEQVTDELAAYFGVFPDDLKFWAERGYDYSANQFWSSAEWGPFITALQEAQAKGDGVITTRTLTTIENTHWGVPAGIQVEVTFVLLGRLFNWESQLSAEMAALLVPSDPAAAADPSELVDSGDFKSFPHYATAGAGINYEKANALAALTAWTVRRNADLFRQILS